MLRKFTCSGAAAVMAVALLWSSTAAAQTQIKVGAGFARWNKTFDSDSSRVDTGSTNTDFTLILGTRYSFLLGLYAGADMSLAWLQNESGGTERSRFDIREIRLDVGFAKDLGIVELDVHAGVKFDVGKQSVDTDELPVSDGYYGFVAGALARFSLGIVDLGARLNMVVPFDRNDTNPGILVDPALLLGVGIGFVRVGLDLAVTYRTGPTRSGVTFDSADAWLFHAIPSVEFSFAGQSLTFALGYQSEDFMLGVPLIGKNARAPEIPPMSLTYRGTF